MCCLHLGKHLTPTPAQAMGPVMAAVRALSTDAILAYQREGSITVEGVTLGEGEVLVRMCWGWWLMRHAMTFVVCCCCHDCSVLLLP